LTEPSALFLLVSLAFLCFALQGSFRHFFVSLLSRLGSGGAIFVTDLASLLLSGTLLSGNSAARGGALAVDAENLQFVAVTISDNWATEVGGGVYLVSGSDPQSLGGITVSNNRAPTGANYGLLRSCLWLVYCSAF
jgi:hypothetical protein